MKRHLRYAWYLARHKWHVLVAGVRLGVPFWRLVVHDWSKFLPSEWTPFVAWTQRPKEPAVDEAKEYVLWDAFRAATRGHYRRNPHHWQHWMTFGGSGDLTVDPMPERYAREMVADWIGAAKAQGNGAVAKWWAERTTVVRLHKSTRELVDQLVERASTEGIG